MVRFYYSSSVDCRNAFVLCVYISRVLPAIKKNQRYTWQKCTKKTNKKIGVYSESKAHC